MRGYSPRTEQCSEKQKANTEKQKANIEKKSQTSQLQQPFRPTNTPTNRILLIKMSSKFNLDWEIFLEAKADKIALKLNSMHTAERRVRRVGVGGRD
jgi:hypothetical protein